MFNGDWGVVGVIGVGVTRRVGINCGWDCTKKLLFVVAKVEENIFNGALLSNGSTWKVELVAGG